MALVVYTELLGRNIHDPLIRCIESDIGQSSEDLALALNRSYTVDGNVILQRLHSEGMLKKVQTELIMMTPTPTTRIKLSELNTILDEMKKGEDAVKKLAEMDSQLGMQDPMQVARRMRGDIIDEPAAIQGTADTLGDSTIADNLRQQAMKMSAEAKGLLAEADRLLTEANSMDPIAAPSIAPSSETPAKKSRGRPKKVAIAG
jgi:hypothetical protein